MRGRKSALVLTILLMAIGTVGIGLIPDYASIGVLAPAFYLIAAALVSGATILTFRETAFERLR